MRPTPSGHAATALVSQHFTLLDASISELRGIGRKVLMGKLLTRRHSGYVGDWDNYHPIGTSRLDQQDPASIIANLTLHSGKPSENESTGKKQAVVPSIADMPNP
jgi:hypothetical protein